MSATKRVFAAWLLAAAAVVGTTQQVHAQRDGRDRAARPAARGIVKTVDATAGTITVTAFEGREVAAEKTYTLAKDAEVALGPGGGDRRGVVLMKEGKLTDLTAGCTVNLILSAEEKVETILVEGPTVRGVLKSVDAANNMLSISLFADRRREEPPEEKSYTVAREAEVALDDGRGRRFSLKEGKLADLVAGSWVSLRLSVDQKQVTDIVAEGPGVNGTVKAVDAGTLSITLTLGRGRGAEAPDEKALVLSTDALVVLDDGTGRRTSLKQGKLSDVPVGAAALAKLSADQKFVTMLRVEGPSVAGQLKAVDAANGTVTLVIGGRGDDRPEKTWPVAKKARITLEGNQVKLADIKLGDDGLFAMLRLSLDQKTVQGIVAGPPRPR
jgi:small nuclear ribonucleoprotein (snRNP)-like protein